MKKQMFPLILLLSLTAGKVSANSFFERLSEDPFSDCSIDHVEEVATHVETETIINPFHTDPFSDCTLDQTETKTVFEDQEEDSDVQTGWGECDVLDISVTTIAKEVARTFAEKASDLYTKASEKAAEIYASKVEKKSEEVETLVKTEPTVVVETVEVASVVETVEAQEVAPVVVDSAQIFEDVTKILKDLPAECTSSVRTKKGFEHVSFPEAKAVEVKDEPVISKQREINWVQHEVNEIIEDAYRVAKNTPQVVKNAVNAADEYRASLEYEEFVILTAVLGAIAAVPVIIIDYCLNK